MEINGTQVKSTKRQSMLDYMDNTMTLGLIDLISTVQIAKSTLRFFILANLSMIFSTLTSISL